jgi:anti-sigma-K factor RskA
MFCHIIQWRIEKQIDDTGQVTSAGLLRHLDTCPACRHWRDSLLRIQQQLQTASPPVSDSDIQRIQATLRDSLSAKRSPVISQTGRTPHTRYRIGLAVSTAAAVILVAAGLFSVYNRPEPEIVNYHEAIAPVTQLPRQLQHRVSELVKLSDQMIESEMNRTKQDLRQSVGFIQSCLPQEMVLANLSTENMEMR